MRSTDFVISDEEDEATPIKMGYLKHDLYESPREHCGHVGTHIHFDHWAVTKKEKDSAIKKVVEKLESQFSMFLSKGTEFLCYIEDNKECWYDKRDVSLANSFCFGAEVEFIKNNALLPFQTDEWAEENLENITKI